MFLAYLGQKKSSKQLKDIGSKFPTKITDGLGRTRERQIFLKPKQMKIMRRLVNTLEKTTPVEINQKDSGRNLNNIISRQMS